MRSTLHHLALLGAAAPLLCHCERQQSPPRLPASRWSLFPGMASAAPLTHDPHASHSCLYPLTLHHPPFDLVPHSSPVAFQPGAVSPHSSFCCRCSARRSTRFHVGLGPGLGLGSGLAPSTAVAVPDAQQIFMELMGFGSARLGSTRLDLTEP